MGLFDLGAPLLAAIHARLETWLPPALEIALWALLCAWASMWLYRRLSRQYQLLQLKDQVRAATRELAAYAGDFGGMLSRVTQALRLTLRQVRLTLGPALLSSLPVLFVLPWLSNTFEYELPSAGRVQSLRVQDPAQPLSWVPDAAVVRTGNGEWKFVWPDSEHPIAVRDRHGLTLFTLPLTTAVPVLHKRGPWNWLIGNPAGYLPGQAAVEAVEISLPAREIIGSGPPWLRHWLAPFVLILIAGSLWLKVRWRLL
jgi:hypothetical protein